MGENKIAKKFKTNYIHLINKVINHRKKIILNSLNEMYLIFQYAV